MKSRTITYIFLYSTLVLSGAALNSVGFFRISLLIMALNLLPLLVLMFTKFFDKKLLIDNSKYETVRFFAGIWSLGVALKLYSYLEKIGYILYLYLFVIFFIIDFVLVIRRIIKKGS